jgi:hypothetical protein
MVGNLCQKNLDDTQKINIKQEWKLIYWSSELGISREQLKQVVDSVGPCLGDIYQEIKNIHAKGGLMKTEKLRIAVIALEDEEKSFYKDLLAEFKTVSPELYSTLHQFKRSCGEKEYSGLIIDNRTLIRSSTLDREFFSQVCEGFPVLRISANTNNTDVSCLIEGKQPGNLSGRQLLDLFLTTDCTQTIPHRVRVNPRRNIFFNTYLSYANEKDPIKTNIWDISEGGCFVLTAENNKKKGDVVTLIINELSDPTPIRSEIRWVMPWGADTKKLPGFGVSFLDITSKQKMEIQQANVNL